MDDSPSSQGWWSGFPQLWGVRQKVTMAINVLTLIYKVDNHLGIDVFHNFENLRKFSTSFPQCENVNNPQKGQNTA